MRERAYVASGGARRADEGPELHRRGVDDRGIRIVVGQDRRHRSEVALARRAGLRASADRPREDAARVGVDDGMPVAVGEHGDGTGGVVADPGQGQQIVDIARNDAVVTAVDLDRRAVEPQRASRVAEVRPLRDRCGGRVGGQCGGRRPSGEPRLEVGDDARDGRLLQHELAHERAPRPETGAAPRQIARGPAIPRDERRCEVGHDASLRRAEHPATRARGRAA